MSFLKTLQKLERIIIGDKNANIKPNNHWKKYIKPKNKKNT